MITQAILEIVISIWNFVVGILPSSEATLFGVQVGHFPDIMHTGASYLGQYMMIWDDLFPVSELYDALIFVWAIHFITFIFRSILWSLFWSSVIRRILSIF